MFSVDLVEWERFCYRRDLSRWEIESMSLREYILRRQAHTRDNMQTVRLQTLPFVNTQTEDTITWFESEPIARSLSWTGR